MNVQKPETKNFLFYKCKDVKQQRITPRYILSDWGIPPRQKQIYSQTLKTQRL